MKNSIQMGNDEFILYFRKIFPYNDIPNDQLGKIIWKHIKAKSFGIKAYKGKPKQCKWDTKGSKTTATKLPKTATQFIINRHYLPLIYDYLDRLGSRE